MQGRRNLRFTIFSLAMLLLAACGASAAPTPESADLESSPQAGGTLTLSFDEDFITFHPYYEVNNTAFKPLIFEAPLRVSDDGGFEPWLAAAWEQAEDGLSITLRLRPDVRFHNGRALTADDLVWAVHLASNQEAGHHLAGRFDTVAGVMKLDDSTVRILYRERSAGQLDALARLYIFPREAAETIDTAPIGTGPFQFVEWIPGDRVTLERFADYWQADRPYLERVVIRPMLDNRARLAGLRSRELDMVYGLPLSERAGLEQLPGMVVAASPEGGAFYAFLININVPPFDRVQVRQAFQHALDRDEIVAVAFHGQAKPLTIPLPTTSWAYAPDLENVYPHDLERARELLAEAGYPAGFSIQMLVRDTSGPYLEQARVFSRQLTALGIQVELAPTPLDQYWPQLFSGDFAIVSHQTGEANVDPSGLFERAACCRPYRSFFGIQDRNEEWFVEYASAIRQARVESDQATRARLYRRALEIWQEQAWTIPTVWEQELYAHWDTVRGVRVDMDGALWLQESWLAPR